MPTAKEMFEALGYEYRHIVFGFYYVKDDRNVIDFDLGRKGFSKHGVWDGMCDAITIDEFKSIHQQMKELGWLDE